MEIAEVSFNKLYDILLEISKRPESPHGTFAEPFLYAWSFIHAINRIRPLLLSIPESESSPEILCLISETEGIKNLWDGVQFHESGKLPLWGAISWFYAVQDSPLVVRNHTIAAGTLLESRQKLVLPIGKLIHPPLDLIKITAHGAEAYLREILDQVKLVSEYLGVLLHQHAGEGPRAEPDIHWNMIMEYKE